MLYVDGMGWTDGWMVIIGHRSSKSTFGAKNALFFRGGVPHGWSKLMKYSGITLKFDLRFAPSFPSNYL